MKKLLTLIAIAVISLLTSCYPNRTYINNYSEKIYLVKRNFPELYQLYYNGDIIIDEVYIYEKNGAENVGINYRYR